MKKRILMAVIALVGITAFSGCASQSPEEYAISPYLPIRHNDSLELTSGWLTYNYPYGKTDFTEAELEILHNTINSLVYYGPSHPWQEEQLYGIPHFLIAKNDNHETRIYFITHNEWGTLAFAIVDDEHQLWFTMDAAAYK